MASNSPRKPRQNPDPMSEMERDALLTCLGVGVAAFVAAVFVVLVFMPVWAIFL